MAVSPQKWKRGMGIEIGGHKKRSSKKTQHSHNKDKSVQWYQENIGPTTQLIKDWGKKIDDMCDAALIARYGAENYVDLLSEAQVAYHHTHYFGSPEVPPDTRLQLPTEWDAGEAVHREYGRNLPPRSQMANLVKVRETKFAKRAKKRKRS